MRILLVDDDELSRGVMRKVLQGLLGHEVVEADNVESALDLYMESTFPLVLTDIRMPGQSGLDLLHTIKGSPTGAETEVVLVTGFADVDTAVLALRDGAADFLRKPVQAAELVDLIQRLTLQFSVPQRDTVQAQQAGEAAPADSSEESGNFVSFPDGSFMGLFSPSMRSVRSIAERFHEDRTVPVLVEGETGTGKEMAARLIHYGESGNDSEPFVPVNCAAISPSLFESELFGYVGGAFTGALKGGAKGKLEAANGGTVFLDEVGEIPLNLQAKLLRALSERAIYRVGGTEPVALDVRVISATNRDLAALVDSGEFRQDLYYRLSVGKVQLPALRKQVRAIAPLAQMFLHHYADQKKRSFRALSREAVRLLENHSWPGNIRELQNVIEHAVLLFDNDLLLPEHLTMLNASSSHVSSGRTLIPGRVELPSQPFSLEELNREIVKKTLEKFDGNKTRTAEFLGITRSALRSRLDED